MSDEKKQKLEKFFDDLSLSLSDGIIYCIHQAVKKRREIPKEINFYGAEDDLLQLISKKVREKLGSERGLYGGIPHTFNCDFSGLFIYNIDIGWFISVRKKNGGYKPLTRTDLWGMHEG